MTRTIILLQRTARSIAVIAFACISLPLFPGCTSLDSYIHKNFVHGEIDEIGGDEIVFCTGDREDMRVGQLCTVYKTIATRNHGIRKITLGLVQVTGFIDDTRARAKILHGNLDRECRVRIMD